MGVNENIMIKKALISVSDKKNLRSLGYIKILKLRS